MHHTLDKSLIVKCWNRGTPPRLWVDSGDTVTLQMEDSSNGQVHPDITLEEFAEMDPCAFTP